MLGQTLSRSKSWKLFSVYQWSHDDGGWFPKEREMQLFRGAQDRCSRRWKNQSKEACLYFCWRHRKIKDKQHEKAQEEDNEASMMTQTRERLCAWMGFLFVLRQKSIFQENRQLYLDSKVIKTKLHVFPFFFIESQMSVLDYWGNLSE